MDAVQSLENQVLGTSQDTLDNDTQGAQEAPQATTVFDPTAWYDELEEGARGLADKYVESHVVKLKSALDEERKQRRAYEKQVKELAGKVTGDSDLKSKLDELGSQLSEANQRALFYEAAVDRGDLPAKRYAAAYKIAKLDGLIDEDGAVDWTALAEQHDYLFTSAQQQQTQQRKPGNAGSGAGTQPQKKTSMNDMIRSGR
jgi:hypothetical protein